MITGTINIYKGADMGLLKVGFGAANSVLADQWREYFYCDSLSNDVLMMKGVKRVTGRSGNTRGSDNIISDGSVIAVNEGQCMLIVQQGAIAEMSAEPGEFVFDNKSQPSIFRGNLMESVEGSFRNFVRRVGFGADTGTDERVYFFNTKEILSNRFGTVQPIPFRAIDTNIGLDMDISLRMHGEYSYKMVDPVLFYKNVAGNVTEQYSRDMIDSQLKTELLSALQPALARVSRDGVRYSQIPAHTEEISNALNEELSTKWRGLRGIQIVSFGIASANASEEDEATIKQLQKAAVFRTPDMAAANLTAAQAQAMQDAAKNPNAGPMMAFAGMNMAAQAGGVNAGQLFAMANANAVQAPQPAPTTPAPTAPTPTAAQGAAAVEAQSAAVSGSTETWTCECGHVNSGKFCSDCGKPRPARKILCPKCGYSEDMSDHPSRFCPNCGEKLS